MGGLKDSEFFGPPVTDRNSRGRIGAQHQLLARAAQIEANEPIFLDRATGQILTNNDISVDEAFKGVVSRPPNQLPALASPPAPNPPAR